MPIQISCPGSSSQEILIFSKMFDNLEWRPPTFTDMQLQSGFDHGISQNEQNFDLFSNNKLNHLGLDSGNSNKFNFSPEPLLSSNVSPEQNKKYKDKLFAEKIFKNMNKKKKTSSFFMKNTLDNRKTKKSKMMDSIIEQNENNGNKLKFNNATSKGFIFTNNKILNMNKRTINKKEESTAIPININDKKKHLFNSKFNVQSKDYFF
jgi:hypothetical protein